MVRFAELLSLIEVGATPHTLLFPFDGIGQARASHVTSLANLFGESFSAGIKEQVVL